MSKQQLKRRYLHWLDYWKMAIHEQHEADKVAEMSDGKTVEPLYADDIDRVTNDLIVATLLNDIASMRQVIEVQFEDLE